MKEKTKKTLLIVGGITVAAGAGLVVGYGFGQKSAPTMEKNQIAKLLEENRELKVENNRLGQDLKKAWKLVNNLLYHLGKEKAEKEIKSLRI